MASGKKQTQNDNREAETLDQQLISRVHAIPDFGRLGRRRIYPKGSVIFAEGHVARGIYILATGRAKLSITSAEGRKLIVRIAREGDLLGLSAALTGNVYEATAETLAPCRLQFISRKDLLATLDRQKACGLGLAVAVSKELEDFMGHARVLLLSNSAIEKVVRVLLMFADQFGDRTAKGISFQTFLTHEEMAQMINTSRETVTRSLNSLKRKQLIDGNGELLIRNQAALLSLVESRAD